MRRENILTASSLSLFRQIIYKIHKKKIYCDPQRARNQLLSGEVYIFKTIHHFDVKDRYSADTANLWSHRLVLRLFKSKDGRRE